MSEDAKILLGLIAAAVGILLLVFPVFFEVRVSYNPLFNRAVVALFVFRVKIFYYVVSFHGRVIELENDKGTKMKCLETSSPQFLFIEEFMRQIKDKLRLKKLFVFYNIGTGDAFSSAMLCGLLNTLLTNLFLRLKSKKPTASFCVYDTISYNKVSAEVAGRAAAAISFFDVAYSFVYSVIITKRK